MYLGTNVQISINRSGIIPHFPFPIGITGFSGIAYSVRDNTEDFFVEEELKYIKTGDLNESN
jgi:hypothetical protein